MNKKKIMKSLLIGGVVYIGMECCYFMGKGNAMGILAVHENSIKPSEAIQLCATDKRWRNKLVAKVARLYATKES